MKARFKRYLPIPTAYPALAAVLATVLSPAGAAVPAGGYSFTPSAKEAELYVRIRDHADQKRVQIVLDPRLCATARKHAADMQARKYFDHSSPDGVNANQRAISEGFPLPSNYAPSQNYIESLAGSVVDTPADAIARWKVSSSHANHVFGKVAVYLDQVVIGVGQAPKSGLGYATYVFLSAPGPSSQQWSVAPAARVFSGTEIDAAGSVRIKGAPPESILEIWKSGTALTSWSLNRVAVVDASGTLVLGQKQGTRGFFRLNYFRP